MYDALNKGLELATGEIIGFLNTDDLYAENIFNEVVKCFNNGSPMAVAGQAIVVAQRPDGLRETVDKYAPENANILEISTRKGPYFNAWFFRRSVFEQIGKFDIHYKIAGDLDFMLRFALNNLDYVPVGKLVYIYQQHEGSLTFVETDQKRVASAKEKLSLADSYLHSSELPVRAKSLMTNLHTRETVELALRSIWKIKIKEFYSYSIKGIRYDFLWPIQFLKTIAIFAHRFFWKQVQK
jgi:GT2 family glycosyltransferase